MPRSYWAIFLILILAVGIVVAAEERDVPGDKRPIELVDILKWNTIRTAILSPDGNWFAYQVAPTEGDGEVVVRSTRGTTEHRFPIGVPAGGGRGRRGGGAAPRNLQFSEDSRWVAFFSYPTQRATRQARANRSGPPPSNSVVLVDLNTADKLEFEKAKSFSFSGENPRWFAIHMNSPQAGGGAAGRGAGGGRGDADDADSDQPIGSDMILRDLSNGQQLNVGNVGSYEFNKMGNHLAWTVDTQDQIGNGIQLRDLDSGIVRGLDSGKAFYRRLNWNKEGDALAVLKGVKHEDYEDDKLISVIAWNGLGNGTPSRIDYDPHSDSSFPSEMSISPNRNASWTEDQKGIVFGIHDIEKKKPEPERRGGGRQDQAAAETEEGDEGDDSERARGPGGKPDEPESPSLVIWHWQDARLQPQQQVQESRDKNFSYLSIYRVDDKKFVRLADQNLRTVTPAPRDQFAVGTDISKYERDGSLDGRRYSDIYVVDMKTGKRKLALEKNRWSFGPSSEGDHILYYEGGHYFAYDMRNGRSSNITEKVNTSFVDVEDDHNVVQPPIRPVGWVKGGQSVLLSDDWDIWNVRADGSGGENLTLTGKKEQIRWSRRFRIDPNEEGIDLDGAFLSAYGEWTKKAGFARLDGKPGPTMLKWDDASFGRLIKAKNADAFVLTRADFDEYADYHFVNADFGEGRRLTDANAQQAEYKWSSGVRLINYESKKGVKHQGALYLPADYEEGKSYPTIVYIYERLSQGLNQYDVPRTGGFSRSIYTSRGYAVLTPDISYTVNDPGMSSVWSVLPALEAAIETGIVDRAKVGLHGHSWGGYQTSFLITQTKAFAAAIAGAPLTNMISMYSSVYWNSGSANQPIFESSQGRFTGGYLDVPEAYARNSPVYFAQNVETPLLLLHNDKDGAVDFNQGVEYYNTLRRLNKPVIMLQYVGENHGLREPRNRKDYSVRMMEFFDHHLKEVEAPEWLAQGISHLDHPDHLEERARSIMPKPEARKEKPDSKDPL